MSNNQEILEDILLKMNYDSSKTLTENKILISEQNTYYYDNSGNLKGGGPIPIPSNMRKASVLYPNLSPSQYPTKIQPSLGSIGTQQTSKPIQIPQSNTNLNYRTLLRDYGLPYDLDIKTNAKSIIAQNLVAGEYEEFMNKLKTINPEFWKKLQPVVQPKPKPKVLPAVDNRSYSDATSTAAGYSGKPLSPLATPEEIQAAKFYTPKIVNVGFDDEFEIPGTSTVSYWNTNDHNNLNSFADSVVFKSGNINDWAVYITIPTVNSEVQKSYSMPIGKVKGFSFNYKGVDFNFKRSISKDGFLNEFGTKINGQYIPYVKTDFINASFWEDFGPTILNIASVAVAVLGPATWPLLLTSAGLDLAAAKMQYEQGDFEGAKLSALLSLTPFLGKFAIKVPKVEADALAQKFVNATTKADVDNIVATLTTNELNTLKSLRELGDINKIQSMVNDPEVKTAINTAAKTSKGIAPKAIQKGVAELSVGVSLFIKSIPNLQRQELENLNRKQVINKVIKTIIDSTNITDFMSDSDKQEVKETISELLPMDEFVAECKRKTEIIRKAKEKALEEENKEILDKTMETLNELQNLIEFLDSQKETDENKLTDDEINNLTT
jgi:hypothetical protein